ncbi:Chitin synthase, class 2 [Blastosporella zonata]|nr:Chitin synthase, class 2 [Blastosporella zonata]
MAYHQNDPYNQQHNNSYNHYPEPNYPPAQQHYNDSYDGQANWDSKSAKSYQSHAGSQVHLMPSYEKHEAPPVPVPSVSYPQNYPPAPAQHPGMYGREASNAYTTMREKMMRRRSVRQVALVHGNLVLDVPVPSNIIPAGKKDVEEMSTMRYTAATCDPDDFMSSRYTLRPYLMGRHTELFIVMTMYNEDEVLFVKTMNAVIKNIAHLCSRGKSKTWGPDGWQKVVVCVVSDGRNKVNKRTLQVLSLMGCYQEGIAKDSVGGKDVTAHIFEYTTSVIVTETGEVGQGTCPVQVLFCLKEQNKKKLNSHRWFFNAFGPLIKPNVCILLDVGTKPTGTSIYELWKCFDKHSSVGGACGE